MTALTAWLWFVWIESRVCVLHPKNVEFFLAGFELVLIWSSNGGCRAGWHKLDAGKVVLIRAQPYVQLVRKMLIEDPFFLLGGMPDNPLGVIPRDGVSWGRDGLRIDRSSES